MLRNTLKLGGIAQNRAAIKLADQTPLDLLPWRLILRKSRPRKLRGSDAKFGSRSQQRIKGYFTGRDQASYYCNLGLTNICSVTGVPHCDPRLSSAR